MKYVFEARSGREQLFDLAADPGELRDLSSDRSRAAEVAGWRRRLAAQFEREGGSAGSVPHGTGDASTAAAGVLRDVSGGITLL
eukprot:gene13939-1087_t